MWELAWKRTCILSKRKHNVLVLKKREKVTLKDEDKIAIRADPERPHYSEMLLDDPDALKTWLTDYLQPMWVWELQGSQQCSVLYKGSLIKGPYDTLSIGL